MKRFLIMIFTFLMCFSLIRHLNGSEPLTFRSFLNTISKLDLDFSNIKKTVSYLKGLEFPEISSFWNVLVAVKNVFNIMLAPFFFLFSLLQDIGAMLLSFIQVFVELCGFNIFGTASPGFGPWSGGGHGGGGGGIR